MAYEAPFSWYFIISIFSLKDKNLCFLVGIAPFLVGVVPFSESNFLFWKPIFLVYPCFLKLKLYSSLYNQWLNQLINLWKAREIPKGPLKCTLCSFQKQIMMERNLSNVLFVVLFHFEGNKPLKCAFCSFLKQFMMERSLSNICFAVFYC